MTQVVAQEPQISTTKDQKPVENSQLLQEKVISSLRKLSEEIGQISELIAEEKLVASQFFASLLKLMQPFTNAVEVSVSILPAQFGHSLQAYVDATGHLAIYFDDGTFELVDLTQQKNLDLTTMLIPDLLPKLKNLATMKRSSIANRIKILTEITKEMQRSSETLSSMEV